MKTINSFVLIVLMLLIGASYGSMKNRKNLKISSESQLKIAEASTENARMQRKCIIPIFITHCSFL